MKNPAAALATLNTAPEGVHSLTLGLVAILEQIESPVATGGADTVSMATWVPTLYAFAHPLPTSRLLLTRGLQAYLETAHAWADTLPNQRALELIAAVRRAVEQLSGISPDDGGQGGDPATNPTAAGPTGG